MDPTPAPVIVVGFSDHAVAYIEHAQDFARLALYAGVLAVFVIVALLTALVVVSGLRR
jgi:hypothetical protein